MQFRIVALDAQAAECRLVLDAPDLHSARRSAAGRGLAVLDIAPVGEAAAWLQGRAPRRRSFVRARPVLPGTAGDGPGRHHGA
jgi:hypothetical protein